MRIMSVESFGISEIGLVRQNNEDVWAELPAYHFYVLADGMGGHQAGEVAARETVAHLTNSIDDFFAQNSYSADEIAMKLKQSIIEANAYVYDLAQKSEELNGMGTTLCSFIIHDGDLIYAHVGDSRIYRFREKLQPLTKDHSLRREIMSRFQLDEKKASSLPFKNVITRAVGTSPSVEPDVNITTTKQNDIYLLCSDGLTDLVSDEEIELIIASSKTIKQASENLVKEALERGGVDNITLVMIKVL